MAKLTIWYSVSNGGDGSAYPRWFESEELADMDQELQNAGGEGWGENCIGSITFEGDNLRCVDRVTTKEDFIKSLDGILSKKWCGKEEKKVAQELKNKLDPPEPEKEEKIKWYKNKKLKKEDEWEEENEKLKSFNEIIG